MYSFLSRLGEPHLGRRTVHIAGSKGKGSVAAMISSALQKAGQPVGLYSKPHLHRFVERVAVDGQPISREDFGRLVGQLAPQIEAEDADGSYGKVSTFEALVALAFLYFQERDVPLQVLEVGMGGRLDATNVLEDKDVCVITPVSLEHTAVLGDTVARIAEEKAAIISKGTTVVMAPQREPAAEVIRRVCAERGAKLLEVAGECAMKPGASGSDGQSFTLRTARTTYKLRLPLLGRHQLANAATAVLALEALASTSGIEMSDQAIGEGLAAARLPGRIEILKKRPLFIADGAHNRDSARALVSTLRDDLGRDEAVLVVGCSADKDIDALADELAPIAMQVIATRSRHPRSMEPTDVAQAFTERDVTAIVQESVGGAVDGALAAAGDGDVVVACGSLFVAAEAREHLLGIEYDPPLHAPAQAGTKNESEVGV